MIQESQESREPARPVAGEPGAGRSARGERNETNETSIPTPSTSPSATPPAVSSAHVPEELAEEPADAKPLHAQPGATRPLGDSPTAPRSSEPDRHFGHAEHSRATGKTENSRTITGDENSNGERGRENNEQIDVADSLTHAALAGFYDHPDHPDLPTPGRDSIPANNPGSSNHPNASNRADSSSRPAPDTSPTTLAADIAGRIHAAIYALGHELGRQLADSLENELTMGQFAFLQFMKRHEDATLSEIASELGIKPSAVTAMIDRLERRGYVTRLRAVAEDRRVVRVYLTDAGRAILSRCELKRRDIVNDLLSALEPEEIEQLISIIEKVEARSRARVASAGTSEGCEESQGSPARSRRNRRRSSRTTAADMTPPHGTQPSSSPSIGKVSHASNPPPAASRARKRAP